MEQKALVFDIKRDCSEDGPGIRTTVFFKGCPLECAWCQNPEASSHATRLSFDIQRCKPETCGLACTQVCDAKCLNFRERLEVDFDCCTRCDECFAVCPTNALEPVGFWIELNQLLYRVLIDEPIFKASGGGVTLSGGEATLQMDFSSRFLQALKQKQIHTVLETSGFFNYRRFKQAMLPYLDLIYFDLKLMDETESRQHTGQGNQLIKENFSKLVKEPGVQIIPRVPLIPGITDTKQNLGAIAAFLRQHKMKDVVLVPYNPLWLDKVQRLGIVPRYNRCQFMTDVEKQKSIHYLKSAI